MRKYTVLMAATALLAVGCAPQPIDHEAAVLTLREAATTYHLAASAKLADAVAALYDEDALMIPPGGDLVEGLEGVRNYRFGFIETPGVELEFEIIRAEVSTAGDMGWTFALGEITINRPEGPPERDVVRDFHTWKRKIDGSWKVVVDVWNSGPPTDG